jgi:16S rRNA (uracil1498-N3)-methyltransferase
MAGIRLFVDQALGAGQSVVLSEDQARYLFAVMRLGPGSAVLVFNGRDGEFAATVAEAGKRAGVLTCGAQTRPTTLPPDLWLLFAPLKKTRTDFVVEKAAELGVRRIVPVQTDFTNADRIRRDRLQAHAVEAAEQCGGTFVPEVADLKRLDTVLDAWPAGRRLIYADEGRAGLSVVLPDRVDADANADAGGQGEGAGWAILIGPEGGFSDGERARLSALPFVVPIALGPRILRADTAAVSALTLFQVSLGDWSS